MKESRGECRACRKKTVVRRGVAANKRPAYVCLNGSCANYNIAYTRGDRGEPWDTQPAPTRRQSE